MARNIKIDPAAIRKLERDVARKLQPRVNAQANASVRDVERRSAGKSVEQVHADLVAELRAQLGDGFQPGDDLWDEARRIANSS